ncbi:MAG TPA: DUF1549 domain-containing protein [Gemmataceae bacterium]|nr:DUF1549 domain-containing protein [Gemmataceae bacterium]
MSVSLSYLSCLLGLCCGLEPPAPKEEPPVLWALQPVIRPTIPAGAAQASNPIDTFLNAGQQARRLKPAGAAGRLSLLRRVYLDLTGLPPSPAEQTAFLEDSAPDAYLKVVDRLLANEQHGVRYARHWLDVLRYADVDENMLAAPGIHLWRDWVIHALNCDLPYDQFVRAQMTGTVAFLCQSSPKGDPLVLKTMKNWFLKRNPTKPIRRRPRTVEMRLETLEDRCCPAPLAVDGADIWKPQDAGNLYGDANNWTLGAVPGSGKAAGLSAAFCGIVSNADCVINQNPADSFILQQGYTGQLSISAGVNAFVNGVLDENPATDSFNVLFLGSGSQLTFSGNSTSKIYNADFSGADVGTMNVAAGSTVIAGAYPGYSTDLIAPCNVAGTMDLGATYGGGETPVSFTNSSGNTTNAIVVQSGGTVNVWAANTTGFPVNVSLNGPSVVFYVQAGGTLNFSDDQNGSDQTLFAAIVDLGTTNVFGGDWFFKGVANYVNNTDTVDYRGHIQPVPRQRQPTLPICAI